MPTFGNAVALRAYSRESGTCWALVDYNERLCHYLLRLMSEVRYLTSRLPKCLQIELDDENAVLVRGDDIVKSATETSEIVYIGGLTIPDARLVANSYPSIRAYSDSVEWRFISSTSCTLWESVRLKEEQVLDFLSPARVVADRWKETSSE